MRYEIRIIVNAELIEVSDVAQAITNNLAQAGLLAANNSHYPYGSAILDLETGLLDVGFGFGVKP